MTKERDSPFTVIGPLTPKTPPGPETKPITAKSAVATIKPSSCVSINCVPVLLESCSRISRVRCFWASVMLLYAGCPPVSPGMIPRSSWKQYLRVVIFAFASADWWGTWSWSAMFISRCPGSVLSPGRSIGKFSASVISPEIRTPPDSRLTAVTDCAVAKSFVAPSTPGITFTTPGKDSDVPTRRRKAPLPASWSRSLANVSRTASVLALYSAETGLNTNPASSVDSVVSLVRINW